MMMQVLSVLSELKESQRVMVSMLQSILRQLDASHDQPELPSDLALPLGSLQELDRFEEKASQKAFFDALVSLQ